MFQLNDRPRKRNRLSVGIKKVFLSVFIKKLVTYFLYIEFGV